MTREKSVIGIDAGSISVSLAELGSDGSIGKTAYAFHKGNVAETLVTLLSEFDLSEIGGIAVTSSTPDLVQNSKRFDSRVSFISAARHLHPQARSILIVGGEKFGVAQFDEFGDYRNYKSNSSCAAGTGSFLDQQAKRLNLINIQEFSTIACANTGEIPKIASRCAVFAKTDLIHAQQEGYSLEAICDGLSFGLAKNIVDTLFNNNPPAAPLVFTGGVSRNQAVTKHLRDLLGMEIVIDEFSHVYGAIGAGLNLLAESPGLLSDAKSLFRTPQDLIRVKPKKKTLAYAPLVLQQSTYPDFDSLKRYDFASIHFPAMPPVETDLYETIPNHQEVSVWMGIDIGSTSTKAVLLDSNQTPLAGFYTRTSGRPVEAVQTIFEAIDDLITPLQTSLRFLGAGTTGSGRRFIGEIIGADIALDEITAHARAAYAIDPEVDTVIEIGGQDSKFTTLRQGMVTFSIMNNVCAAGTGSFIEEQAKKLNCPLDDYSRRAERVASPVTSDKCTVFMERDLNNYLSEGYSVDEALASALHSVRDNYLTKVANEKNMGQRIFFQGATAKNKALVAAFEQKLNKPIRVSKFCHLTGAMGVALHLSDQGRSTSSFRGIDLYQEQIPVRTEVCDLCANHCKIKLADVNHDLVAFGFLCGRDYETKKFVREGDGAFDLLKTRKKAFGFTPSETNDESIVIGIPAALHLVDDLYFWRKFFDLLSIKTITSESCRDGVRRGKHLVGAEFCSPISSLHGHAEYLVGKADYLFLPDYLEEKEPKQSGRRHYCYYTQYASSLIAEVHEIKDRISVLNPLLRTIRGTFHTKVQLYKMLRTITAKPISFFRVSAAYDKATAYHTSCLNRLKAIFRQETAINDDISVVLLGRPYTVLSPSMNSKIPEIFAKSGIRTFFQDMLTIEDSDLAPIQPLLDSVHWYYAARIFEATEAICTHDNLYPVLVTSFKCTPDSFVIDVFKKILDSRKKPYLILQLDDHDSSIGYETRIEAGIRAFRNHFSLHHQVDPARYVYAYPSFIKGMESLQGKTLLLPNYDELPNRLIEACLRKEGIDARLIIETPDSVRRSISLNNGQCLPASMMTQAAIEYIHHHELKPEETVLWSIDSNISCNLGVIKQQVKSMLEAYGNGMEHVAVYEGAITYFDLSLKISLNAYFAFMFGGLLKKMGCVVRPYEKEPGSTQAAIERSMAIFYDAFLNDTSKEEALRQVIPLFEVIKTHPRSRPKVAIFGDLYARDNDVVNQNLIATIEENGGEAITTPYNEYVKIIANSFIQKWVREGFYSSAATAQVFIKTVPLLEKKYYAYFNRILQEPNHLSLQHPEDVLARFNISPLHTGESLETILKIFTLINNYPDIALFVQTSPSLCCPSLVTQAMANQIEAVTGIPVVTIEYDGTGGTKNDDIIPYLKYPRRPVSAAWKQAQ